MIRAFLLLAGLGAAYSRCIDCSEGSLDTAVLRFSSKSSPSRYLDIFVRPNENGTCPSASSITASVVPVRMASPTRLCSVSNSTPAADGAALIAFRGDCTFQLKAEIAVGLGATMLFAVNYEDVMLRCSSNSSISIPVLGLTSGDGQRIVQIMEDETDVTVQYFWREQGWFDTSTIFIYAMAVSTALVGSWWSASAERREASEPRQGRSQNPEPPVQETQTISMKYVVGFLGCASLLLIALFFLMKYMRYVILVIYLIGATNATAFVCSGIIMNIFPPLAATVPVRFFGEIEKSYFIGVLPAIVISAFWFSFKNKAWFLQDVMGICLSITFLSSIRIPSFKVAVFLLGLALVYDVFWVYISPYIFAGQSVMVAVATGQGKGSDTSEYVSVVCDRHYGGSVPDTNLPMLLIAPRFSGWIPGMSMLGLGDIVLPSLLISYALRFDYSLLRHTDIVLNSGYMGLAALRHLPFFCATAISYAFGLILAHIAVYVIGPQPALLYLSPATLLAVLIVAKRKGNLRKIWLGPDHPSATPSNFNETSDVSRGEGGEGGEGEIEMVTGEAPPSSAKAPLLDNAE